MTVARLAMPVHNAGCRLAIAIESVCAQSRGDFTVTVLDDGSSDGSWDLLQQYAQRDPRIILHRNAVCSGLVEAWNKVAQLSMADSGGEYFAWISDHDRLAPDWLEVLASALETRKEAVLAYPMTCYTHDLNGTDNHFTYGPEIDSGGAFLYNWLTMLPQKGQFAGDMIYGLMRPWVMRAVGGLPCEIFPDRLFMLKLAILGGIAYAPTTVRYRFVPERDTTYRKPMEKQLNTLFNERSRPAFPYMSSALHFLREPVEAQGGVVSGNGDAASLQFYVGLLHAQYIANNYHDEIKRELNSSAVLTAFPRGLIYFMQSGLSGEWQFLFSNIAKLKEKLNMAYTDIDECRDRIKLLKRSAQKTYTSELTTPASPHASQRLVDIAICTFNRSRVLKICLDALLPQFTDQHRAQVGLLVIDNNCVDDTEQMVAAIRSDYPFIRYLLEPKQGLSNARNCASANSDAQYICYLDDDGRPAPDYLDTLVSILMGEKPDFAGGPILPYYLTEKPAWFKDEFEIRRHVPGTGFFDCPISGGNFIVLRSLLLELGGFAPHLGMVGDKVRLGEERELIERYRQRFAEQERRIYYSQALFIFHYVPPVKMTHKYILWRAYQSGKMSVIVKGETLGTLPWVARKLVRRTWALAKHWGASETPELKMESLRECVLLIGKVVGLVRSSLFAAGRNSPHSK